MLNLLFSVHAFHLLGGLDALHLLIRQVHFLLQFVRQTTSNGLEGRRNRVGRAFPLAGVKARGVQLVLQVPGTNHLLALCKTHGCETLLGHLGTMLRHGGGRQDPEELRQALGISASLHALLPIRGVHAVFLQEVGRHCLCLLQALDQVLLLVVTKLQAKEGEGSMLLCRPLLRAHEMADDGSEVRRAHASKPLQEARLRLLGPTHDMLLWCLRRSRSLDPALNLAMPPPIPAAGLAAMDPGATMGAGDAANAQDVTFILRVLIDKLVVEAAQELVGVQRSFHVLMELHVCQGLRKRRGGHLDV
mmetsp:Transcript_52052/g.97374  ORF Transcript_52052/g.97374 Transcript_52052/m.97374 type:complete len:304 (-) Transcript_52052:84-995(-)